MQDNKEIIAIKNINNHSIDEMLKTQNSILPSSDIYENPDEYVLISNMPGVPRSEVQVKVVDDSLILFGKTNYDESVNRKYILNENEPGNYFRKFKISDSIDETKISAKYDNGQLTVLLPKHDKIKPRSIDIA
ncbi:MAG: Hsp20/alpha crystallin family protein [Ignavibacteriales bacterium]